LKDNTEVNLSQKKKRKEKKRKEKKRGRDAEKKERRGGCGGVYMPIK